MGRMRGCAPFVTSELVLSKPSCPLLIARRWLVPVAKSAILLRRGNLPSPPSEESSQELQEPCWERDGHWYGICSVQDVALAEADKGKHVEKERH